ncbi:hypothetical protein PG997_009601 [Apiospora hydei]|uniref:Uncharacterized protein n=1 Tax=Apiospora hydei TaxID=1337664 RepID=A0ABR1VUK9_9PEZI
MPFTSPTTEPFPQYDEYDYQNVSPQTFGFSSRAYEGASATSDTHMKKPHLLNPEAVEFVSPSRTSGTLTEANTPLNAGKGIAAPLKLAPVVQLPMAPAKSSGTSPAAIMPTSPAKPAATPTRQQHDTSKPNSLAPGMSDHKDNNKGREDGDEKDEQSDIKDFASFNKSRKSTAESVIPADETGQAEERKSPAKKQPLTKHKQNKKSKSQTSQGTHAAENGSGGQAQKESGKKTQSSSDDRPASHSSDKADKQKLGNNQNQKQGQSEQKGLVSKGSNAKGKSAAKEVPDNQPVVPGAIWVEGGEPKKATKKKNLKRHASKGKPVAKAAGSSVDAAPTLSKEPDCKGEQGSGSQATSRGSNSEHKAKVNRRGEAENQSGLEKAVVPAPKANSDAVATASTETAAEAKERETPANQSNECEQKTSKGSATEPHKEAEPSSSTQAKKGKGKKQKASAASQNVTTQDKDLTVPSVVAPAPDDTKVERRDTMASLSKADLPSILDDNDVAALSSSGTKTPDLRDAPAPDRSPWRKDGKNTASEKRNEEGASVVPETLREGEERKGG